MIPIILLCYILLFLSIAITGKDVHQKLKFYLQI